MRAVILLGVLLACANASALETTYDLLIKADAEFLAADKKLNEVYQRALQAHADDDSEVQKTLRESQRAWIQFRNLECKFARVRYGNGSLAPLAGVLRSVELTKQRIKELEEYLPH